jgi:hypothetical protein
VEWQEVEQVRQEQLVQQVRQEVQQVRQEVQQVRQEQLVQQVRQEQLVQQVRQEVQQVRQEQLVLHVVFAPSLLQGLVEFPPKGQQPYVFLYCHVNCCVNWHVDYPLELLVHLFEVHLQVVQTKAPVVEEAPAYLLVRQLEDEQTGVC